jgi:hypothetical protein
MLAILMSFPIRLCAEALVAFRIRTPVRFLVALHVFFEIAGARDCIVATRANRSVSVEALGAAFAGLGVCGAVTLFNDAGEHLGGLHGFGLGDEDFGGAWGVLVRGGGGGGVGGTGEDAENKLLKIDFGGRVFELVGYGLALLLGVGLLLLGFGVWCG